MEIIMRKYLFTFLTLTIASINVLSAESAPKSCHCKNCQCTPEKHCGCYSEAGCHSNGTECPGCPEVEKESIKETEKKVPASQ
jgi:hypothetical protein